METFLSLAVGLGLGSVLTVLVTKKLEQYSNDREKLRSKKEIEYSSYLTKLMGYRKGFEDVEEQKKFIWYLNTSAVITASDEVYKLAIDYINTFDRARVPEVKEPERQKIYAKLVITMRNELNKLSGQCPTRLVESDIQVTQLN